MVRRILNDGDANALIRTKINDNFKDLYAATSGPTGLLWLASENGQPVLTKEAPREAQTVVPVGWLAAEPGVWTTLATIDHSAAIAGHESDFVENNRYAIKLWIVSEIARTNVQIRSQAIDTTDGTLLATATAVMNLTADRTPTPVWFENVFLATRKVELGKVRTVISIMPVLFGVQMGITTSPPNELSFISPTFTGVDATARESALLLSALRDTVQWLVARVESLEEDGR